MQTKPNPFAAVPALMKQWQETSMAIASRVNPVLAELVKIRVSQINGCANCIHLHTASARQNGETEQRIYLLSAWREAPCYDERERAAFGWVEALTRLAQGHTQASAYDALCTHFTEEEQVTLTLLINIIDGWNRISIAFDVWTDTSNAKTTAAAA